jgi:acyl carrier protein
MAKKQAETIERAMMTQVTLLQPKVETSDEALATLFKGVHGLQKHIPCVLAVSTGENRSNQHRGWTHGIIIHFEDEARMRDAMTHPTYQKMQEKAQSFCQHIITFELPETLSFPAPVQEKAQEEDTAQKQRGRLRQPVTPPMPQVPVGSRWKIWSATQIDARLKKIVIDQLNVDESEVVPHASLVEDLNADSLDLVEYIMSIEEQFNIKVSDEDAESLTTVGETQAYLMDKGVLS